MAFGHYAVSLIFRKSPNRGQAGAGYCAIRRIGVIVPFPAGGPVDIPARLIAQRLSDTMGQQIVIDNRGGASARIGLEPE